MYIYVHILLHTLIHTLIHIQEQQLARMTKIAIYIEAQRKHHSSETDLCKALNLPNVKKMNYIIKKGQQAREQLVESNMKLVIHVAKYYRYRGVAYPDLIEEGTFGLMKSVEKFDPDKGFRFSTYATWWIRQSVCRAIAEKSRCVCITNTYVLIHIYSYRYSYNFSSCRIIRLPVHVHDLQVYTYK